MSTLHFTRSRPTRTAFTIVELLVALALVIFIMSLVSTVFVLATKSFRDMKAAGDLTEQLRATGQLIRKMLKTTHLSKNTNDFQLSDNDLWKPTDSLKADQRSEYRWRTGYFRFEQTDSADATEGSDLSDATFSVYRSAQAADHRLSMSCIMPNTSLPQDLFSASRPSNFNTLFSTTSQDKYYENSAKNNLNRRQMEMALFLAAPDTASLDSTKTGLLSSSVPSRDLFALHLKTWILNDLSVDTTTAPSSTDILELGKVLSGRIYAGSNWTFNGLDKVSDKENRAATTFFATADPTRYTATAYTANPSVLNSSTIVLRNVVSFEVRLLKKFLPGNPSEFNESTGAFIFDTDVAEQRLTNDPFDKAPNPLPTTVGSNVKISAIKIVLRVYDPDNEITRQLTIIEPL